MNYFSSEEYLRNKLINESKDLDTFFEQLQRIKTAKIIAFTPANTPTPPAPGGTVAKITVFRDAIEEMHEASQYNDDLIKEAYIRQRVSFEMKIRKDKIQKIKAKINALLNSDISEIQDIQLDILQRDFQEYIIDDDFESKRMQFYDNQEN